MFNLFNFQIQNFPVEVAEYIENTEGTVCGCGRHYTLLWQQAFINTQHTLPSKTTDL